LNRGEGCFASHWSGKEGLTDIEGFSNPLVIWAFHKAEGFSLFGKAPSDDHLHGVFATRSASRREG
jgi:tRNA (Thr-GGU) A37 N-methylase